MRTLARPTGLRFHARLLGGVIVLVLSSQVAFRDQHSREHRQIQKNAFSERSREIEARWKALSYTNATQKGFADVFLGKIDWSPLRLSPLQKARLDTRLRELIRYLQNPKFEEYYRLKTEGLQYRFKANKEVNRLFAQAQLADPRDASQEEKGIVRFLWNKFHTQGEHPSVPKITAACLDQIAVATSQTNSSWSLVGGKVGKGFTVADVAYEPGFRYLSLDKSALETPGAGLFVQLSFFAKFNGSDHASPVYISLGWLEQEENWALCRMVTDTWARIKTMF